MVVVVVVARAVVVMCDESDCEGERRKGKKGKG